MAKSSFFAIVIALTIAVALVPLSLRAQETPAPPDCSEWNEVVSPRPIHWENHQTVNVYAAQYEHPSNGMECIVYFDKRDNTILVQAWRNKGDSLADAILRVAPDIVYGAEGVYLGQRVLYATRWDSQSTLTIRFGLISPENLIVADRIFEWKTEPVPGERESHNHIHLHD